jgi:DNA polymerase I-like protein with 3'-5' exonuclease and polymerase domains
LRLSSNVILNPKDLREKAKYFLDRPRFIFDVETVGKFRGEPVANQVTWLSLATAGQTVVVPMGHPNGNRLLERARKKKDPVTKKFVTTEARWDAPPDQMRPAEVFDILYPLFFDEEIEKGAHNSTFDFLSVAKYFGGKVPVGPYHDNIVAAWLLNENRRLGLKDLTERRYKRKYDFENVGRRVEVHPFNKVATYAYMDGKYTWLHLENNLYWIQEEGLQEVYDLEMDVLRVLLDIGSEGTPVDIPAMQRLEVDLSERRTHYEGQIYTAAGQKFNLNSPKQKVDVLYGKKAEGNQGLKPWRLTKGGMKKQEDGKEITLYDYSTDAESLEKFHGNHVVDALLQFQEVDRVLGTYIQGYLGVADDPKKPGQIFDGRVYPDFVQYGTVTGRFSCRAPNLQNIPRPDTDLGKAVRSLFVAGDGHKLVVADYGQIELVVLAHFVGRGALYEGFFQGIDPHTMTAALVFEQDPQDLQARVNAGEPTAKGYRQAAKAINFAVVYGAGPDKVASMAGVTSRRAKQILATHEQEFPEIYAFKDKALKVCKSRKPPHLTTLMGRKRRLPSIMSSDYKTKGKAERQAINSLIQGSAADLIKLAMVRTNEALAVEDTGRMLLSVHDELVVRCTEEKAEKCAEIVKESMTGAGIQKWVDVPLAIDLNIVDKWAEAK